MDFNLIKQSVSSSEIFFEGALEHPIDSDITLPDYCPDIVRILKCTVTPCVTQSAVTGNRVNIEGNAVIRLIYAGEGGSIKCYEQTLAFTKYTELNREASKPCVSVSAKMDYVNCRAVNQRRVDIHASAVFGIRVTGIKSEELVCQAEGAGVQLKTKNISLNAVVGEAEQPFTLSETLEIGSGKPPVSQIMRCSAVAIIREQKAVTNKLLIKGELIVKTLYCPSDDSSVQLIEHSIPISQIVEIEGIDDSCNNETVLSVTSVEITPKLDAGGEMRLLNACIRICARVHSTKSMEIAVAEDAYSTEYELMLERRSKSFETLLEVFSDTYLNRNTIELSGTEISRVIDLWCGDITSKALMSENGFTVSGVATVCMIAVDKDNQPVFIERQTDYEYKRDVAVCTSVMKCTPNVFVTASDYILSSESRIDVRLEMNISASVYSMKTENIISAITPDEEQIKNNDGAALTIYFSDAGESVWNIARKYNTTIRAVMNENKLSSDTVSEKMMLLIPSV